jgi:hypothetical protein
MMFLFILHGKFIAGKFVCISVHHVMVTPDSGCRSGAVGHYYQPQAEAAGQGFNVGLDKSTSSQCNLKHRAYPF